jgi:nucleotide-binding universal stress UspA family protein
MVRPNETETTALDEHPLYTNVLVPLDGSPVAEFALERAVALGSLAHARYTLVRIVAPVFAPLVTVAHASLATRPDEEATVAEVEHARAYLDQQAETLRQDGLRVDVRVLLSDYAAAGILATAREVNADLIAMCTHRHGAARMILGSTADKVLRAGTTPLLLMHPRVVGT